MEAETGGGDGSETGSVMEPENKSKTSIDASLTQGQREEQHQCQPHTGTNRRPTSMPASHRDKEKSNINASLTQGQIEDQHQCQPHPGTKRRATIIKLFIILYNLQRKSVGGGLQWAANVLRMGEREYGRHKRVVEEKRDCM